MRENLPELIYNQRIGPPGYRPVAAVGTTYSLDFEPLVSLMLSFEGLGDAGDDILRDKYRILTAIREQKEKIALFCNVGGIHISGRNRKSPLFSMLDECVFEVGSGERPRALDNFHPKIWLIKEEKIVAEGEKRSERMRPLVMSRNLTCSEDLDIAVAMTASIGEEAPEEEKRHHKPLKSFILRLAPYAGKKRKMVEALAADLDRISRFECSAPFVDYDFLPMFFGENLNEGLDYKQALPTPHEMIVISPFIDYNTLSWLDSRKNRDNGKRRVLVTRIESLTDEILHHYRAEGGEIWTVADGMVANGIQKMDLHAKIYYIRKSYGSYLWIGSANATTKAFAGNCEFTLCLKYGRSQEKFEKFKKSFGLVEDDNSMFRRLDADYMIPAETKTEEDENYEKALKSLEMAVRRHLIFQGNLQAEIERESGMVVKIRATDIPEIPCRIYIAPLLQPERRDRLMPDSMTCRIEGLSELELSEFYILTVESEVSVSDTDKRPLKVEMIIKVPTEGLSAERDTLIFRHFINNRESLERYIELLLSDTPASDSLSLLSAESSEDEIKDPGGTDNRRPLVCFENMLKALSRDPDRIRRACEAVKMAGKGVASDELQQLMDIFRKTIQKHKEN